MTAVSKQIESFLNFYQTALQNFQDFCVAYVAYLVGDEEYGGKNPCDEEVL